MSLQLAQRILSQAVKRTPKSTTTRPPGSKPSLGQAFQGEGEFKAYNLDRLLEGQAVFRSVISKFRDTPQEETTLSKKAEQMLLSNDTTQALQRSKSRTEFRRLIRELNRGATPSSTKPDIPQKPREDTGRRPTPVHYLPIPGNIPSDPGDQSTIPDEFVDEGDPESDSGYPTPPFVPWPSHEPEEWKTGVYSCEAAEADAAALGVTAYFCPRDAQTISIRALLRGA